MAATSAGALLAGSCVPVPNTKDTDQQSPPPLPLLQHQQPQHNHQLAQKCGSHPAHNQPQPEPNSLASLYQTQNVPNNARTTMQQPRADWPLNRPGEPTNNSNNASAGAQVVLAHQPLLPQQRLQMPHAQMHNLQQQQQQQAKPRFSYINQQRQQQLQQHRVTTPPQHSAGNAMSVLSASNANDSGEPIPTMNAPFTAVAGASSLQPEQPQLRPPATLPGKPAPDIGPNVAPGWRRHILNNDIIYFR